MTLTLRSPNRLFVALDLPDDLRDALARTGAEIAARHGGRAVPAESLHATVAFLGDVPPGMAAALEDALLAARGPALRVRLGPLVARPSAGRARLVAVTLEDAGGDLVERWVRLAAAVASATGIAGEDRVWPHVTLVRFRRPGRVDIRGEWYPGDERTFALGQMALYDSHRDDRGPPRYEPLVVVRLASAGGAGAHGIDLDVPGPASRGTSSL